MGGNSSKESSNRGYNDSDSIPYAYPPPQPPPQGYPEVHPGPGYPEVHPRPEPTVSPSYGARPRPKFNRKYSQIADNYRSLDQVSEALAQAGLESSNLIVGIDFTKSNEWTGKHSFNKRCLHHIGDVQNPYEQAISIIGRTLSVFDEDNLIPCFGFGDATTHDQDVFAFYPDERPCNGFVETLRRYREIVPHLPLAGPTSFAPIIEMAMTIVEQSGGQYHVLVIIADGQVTRSVDTEYGQLSPQEQRTVDAIVKASEFPLSIILVGVGDGPWDTMKEFDDNIPARSFDNFQFVNFTSIMSKNLPLSRKETEFALEALMEIPSQYKAATELGILGRRSAKSPRRVPLPPPISSYSDPSSTSTPLYPTYETPQSSAPPITSSSQDNQAPHTTRLSWDDFPSMKASVYPAYETPPSSAPPILSSSQDDQAPPAISLSWDDFPAMRTPKYPAYETPQSSAPPIPSSLMDAQARPATKSSLDDRVCPICLRNPKNMAFGCGHQTCYKCGPGLQACPICRTEIVTRIRLH